jgi:hypothetical protein
MQLWFFGGDYDGDWRTEKWLLMVFESWRRWKHRDKRQDLLCACNIDRWFLIETNKGLRFYQNYFLQFFAYGRQSILNNEIWRRCNASDIYPLLVVLGKEEEDREKDK